MKKISFKDAVKKLEIELELGNETVILDLTEPNAGLLDTDFSPFKILSSYLRNDKNKTKNIKLLKEKLTISNLNDLITQIGEEFTSKKK